MNKYLFFSISLVIVTLCTHAQNTSPYWSLVGNNNATAASKIGTTNNISLRFYTNNVQRMIINSADGFVGIGTSSPVNILTVKSSGGTPAASWLSGLNSPVFDGFAEGVSSEFVLSTASSVSAGRRSVFQGRRSRGTLSAPTVLLNNDYITSFLASGFDGGVFQNPATIDFFVDGTPSAGNVPARISFVTGTNAANRLERLKVGSTGNFNFNNSQLTILQASGNVGIGTDSPATALHIKRDNEALRLQGALPYMGFYNTAGVYKGFVWQGPGDNLSIGTSVGNTVGKVQLYNNGSLNMALSNLGVMEIAGNLSQIQLKQNGRINGLFKADDYNTELSAYRAPTQGGQKGNLLLQVDAIGEFASAYAGNVGIGTVFPSQKLSVTGNASVSGKVGIGVSNPLNYLQIGVAPGFSGNQLAIGNGTKGMSFFQDGATSHWYSTANFSILGTGGVGTGDLGIGYDTPLAGYKLSVNGGAHIAGTLVTTGFADFGTSASVHQNLFVGNKLGIGGEAVYPLEIFNTIPNQDTNPGDWVRYDDGNGFQSSSIAVKAHGGIIADYYWAYSDARLKEITEQSNTSVDLAILNALRVRDYTMKDKMKYGGQRFKKVIAQDVEKVFPEIVSKKAGFIPNVYQVTSNIEKNKDGYLLTFPNKHTISKAAKKLQLVFAGEQRMTSVDIVCLPSDYQAEIKAANIEGGKAFVYGEEVDDLRTMDYEGLTTLNISATQELSKLVAMQQAAIDALQEEVRKLKEVRYAVANQ